MSESCVTPPPEFDDENCWNCGEPGRLLSGYAGLSNLIYHCSACDVDWILPIERKTQAQVIGQRIIYDDSLRRQWKIDDMIDFTDPDAPSSPA